MKKIILSLFITFFCLSLYSQNIEKDTFNIKEVEVVVTLPYQATNDVPVTFKNLSRKDIESKNYGQDPSFLLINTPSVTNYSDAGSYWGYSYIRLRGIDQTRINMTLNGVPLNEPEDQGTYFSNYPDFLQSINMVQIQRGAGMTKNGVASFAGSLNFETLNPENINNNLDVNVGSGSFGTSKYSIGVNSDDLYIRISKISTDGYKEHSGNKSSSLFFINNYKINNNNLKLVFFLGNQKNQLSWLGSTKEQLDINPRYNSCTTNENDIFTQSRLQIHHELKINSKSNLNSALYYNYLKGNYTYQYYYDEELDSYPHTSIDNFGSIDKYNLESNTIGFFTNYIYSYKNINVYTGINGQIYNRVHNGQTWYDVDKFKKNIFNINNWNDFEYFNTGYRNEISSFIKIIYNLNGFNIFQDYQYRHSTFSYKGDVEMDKFIWNFFNSTIGIQKKINNTILYYSISKVHREPTRNDIFMGMDNLWSENAYDKMKPESVLDNELGIKYLYKKLYLNANIYYMKFKNEITLNGYFGPTGLLLHSSVDNSFRSGLEIDFKYKIKSFELINTSSFSYNKIKVEDIEYNPVLTPNILINQDLVYNYKNYIVGLSGRYQGESYIDLTNNHKLNDFFYLNANLRVLLSNLEVGLFVNNITNNKYFTNGLISDSTPLYFIQAPINYFINFKMIF